MHNIGVILTAIILLTSCNNHSQSPINVKWEVIENGVKPNYYSTRFTITNISGQPLDNDWELCYNHFSRRVELVGADTAMVELSQPKPSYYKIRTSEHYKPLASGDSIVININTRGSFINRCYGVDGGHYVNLSSDNPTPIAVNIEKPLMNNSKQWIASWRAAPYPDGELVYQFNQSIYPDGATYIGGFYDILPTPKSIKLLPNDSISLTDGVSISGDTLATNYLTEKLTENSISTDNNATTTITIGVDSTLNSNNEYYTLTIANKAITITGASAIGALNGAKSLISAIERNNTTTLPAVEICDYPDMAYRGMMLDISRNFTTVYNAKQLIDALASYKINYFHLHFSDDEGWRVEIPGLPELTDVGSRRGWYEDNEDTHLFPTFTGTGSPDDNSTANGYYTCDEFKSLLQYAKERGVMVIPEIEAPGHARAAIISMKARYNRLKDSNLTEANRYKIWDDRDSSKYVSAQNFTDNVIDVSSEGTYNFISKVADEIIKMYADADVYLPTIHIGGDEVPNGSWSASPNIQQLKSGQGIKTAHDVGAYFIQRTTELLADKGVKASGWQEVALNHSDEQNHSLSAMMDGVYVWRTIGSGDTIPYAIANSGYGVVLCNVNNFYLDMSYNSHQDEPGLNWGGYVDEFASWSAQPYNLYRSDRENLNRNVSKDKPQLTDVGRKNIKGVQAELFSETIRDYAMVEYYNFPKIFGMVERGWNATPTWGDIYSDNEQYNTERIQYNLMIGLVELPRLHRKGINFQLGQPGITVTDNTIIANAKYPDVTIRYTLDGSEPTMESDIWSEPLQYNDSIKVIKAKAYYLDKSSLTTFWFKTNDTEN